MQETTKSVAGIEYLTKQLNKEMQGMTVDQLELLLRLARSIKR